MYRIDLKALLQLMEEFQYGGVLVAELPRGAFGIKEPCQAAVELTHGKVSGCSIHSQTKRYASGQYALQMLIDIGILHWQLQAQQPAIPPPAEMSPLRPVFTSPPPPQQMVSHTPKRVLYARQDYLDQLTRKQRRVYVLIDGARSAEKIAQLVSSSPNALDEVLQTLQELAALGLITLS